MKKEIAFCGIDCSTCEAHIATLKNDNEMRKEVAQKWCKLNNTDLITPESINCMGCRNEGVKYYFCSHMCQIKKCCADKGYETCGNCPEMEHCEKLRPLHEFDPSTKENLKH